jgi:hypothetical protein
MEVQFSPAEFSSMQCFIASPPTLSTSRRCCGSKQFGFTTQRSARILTLEQGSQTQIH